MTNEESLHNERLREKSELAAFFDNTLSMHASSIIANLSR